MIKKIAIIGATGMLGKPVARELAGHGFEVTALVRNPATASLPKNIRVQPGDVANLRSLEELFTGQDAVYINLNLKQSEKEKDFHAESDGLKNIIHAARAKGIRRICFISSLVMNYQGMNGFHWWVFDMKHKAIKMIKESGIPFTIFYPSSFMDNFHSNYRQGNKLLLSGTSEFKMWFVASDDYAKQVANSLKTSIAENKEYAVQGTESFTADEATIEFIKHYKHEKLTISRAPLGLLRFLGRFVQKINYASHIIEALNRYPEKFEAEDTWRDLGKPETTLQRFAQRKRES